jgi:hypothetical protein
METYEQTKQRILDGFGTHNYLREAIKVFDDKDCVDALNDAETLYLLMKQKFNEAIKAFDDKDCVDALNNETEI